MKRALISTGVLVLLLASVAAADPGDTLWARTYGGSDADYGYCVQQTADGGYIIAGYTDSFGAGVTDFYLIKTDAAGDTLWSRTYGGLSYDQAFSAQQTTDGGYVVTGFTFPWGSTYSDYYLVKTDPNGDTLWTRTYGGSDADLAYSVQETSDGGYIIAGYTSSFGNGEFDYYLVKTDADGDTMWTRTYGGTAMDKGYSVQQTTDGGYIVAGETYSFGAGITAVYLVKTDADGDTLWTRSYGGTSSNFAESVQQTTDGGYIAAGGTTSFGAGSYDFYLVKTDANGDSLWTRTYGGSAIDRASSVQQTSDGGYIIAGETMSFGAGSYDFYLVKTDADGDTLWTRAYGGDRGDCARSVQQTTDGGYITAGYTFSFGAGLYDFWLLRLTGEELPAVSIEIVPDDPPVTVPQGGTFGYRGTVTNNTEDPQVTDVWVMASGPQKGIYGPFKEFENIPLAPSQSRSRHLNQRVLNAAPLGFYNYIAYCGDYPSAVTDSSFFQIEVVEGVGSSQAGWILTGSFLEGDLADGPSNFAVLGNYPNPFNASTVITYELPTTSHVRLEVFNIAGQQVATLVDSKQQSGYRSVVWDASEVSSGVYFYRLSAGDFTEIKRMLLVK